MLEEIDEAFFALDWEYRYVHANQAALRITGKPLVELLGRTPWEAFPQLQGSLLEEHYREAMELGVPSVFEHRSVVSGDWLEIRIYPTSAGVSAYYRVINERKRVEQELRHSQERERLLAEVVEKADVPFAIRESNGRLVLFNEAFAQLTGYTREELEEGASTLAVELTPPDWWEVETPLLAQAVAERRPVRFEKEYARKDGSRVPIEVFTQPVFDDAGGLVHYRSFLTDISARKQAAETLRESEERFRSLFESTTEGVVLHEVIYEDGRAVDYRILDVNPSFESQTGMAADGARGRLASELYGTGEPPYLAEYAQVAKSGRPYSFDTYFEPMDRHFRITATSPAQGRFATVFEDITERVRTEGALRRSEDAARQAEERYRNLFDTLIEGFCIIEMVFDAGGSPVDYRFLEINQVFEEQTGLHDAQGKLMRELAPGHDAHWFEIYGKVAVTGEPARFQAPATALGRYFDVSAFRVGEPENRHVGILFNDITEAKRAELESQRLLEESQAQAEELQAQSEELQALGEELQAQNEELLAQRDSEVEVQQRLELELESTNLLLEAATATISWTDLDQMLGSLGDLLLRSTRHSRVLLELWDAERREIEIAVSRGSAATAKQRFPFDSISDGAKEVITTRKTLVIDYAETGMPVTQKEYVDEHAFLLMLVVPIVHRERLIGLVTLDEPGEQRPFSAREIKLVEAIAGQAGVAVENARLYEEAVERERLSAALNDIAVSITAPLDYNEILTRVVGQTGAAVGAESSAICSLSAGELVPTHVWQLPVESVGVPIPRSRTPYVDIAAASRQVVAVDDCETDPRVDLELQHEWNVRSVMAAPLVVRDAVVGAMFFNFHSQQHRFTAPEIDFVRKAAAAVSGALENARLFAAEAEARQELEQELQTTTQLLEAAEALAESIDVREVVRRLAQTALALASHSRVIVDLWDDARSEIEVVASEGALPLELGSRWPIGEVSLAARKAILERHHQVWDLDKLSEPERGSAAGPYRSHLTLYVPLLRGEKVVGLLVMDDPGERREFSDREIKVTEGIAAQAAVAIENARLFEEQQSQGERLRAQSEELQSQSEELQVQSEELQSQNEELKSQSEELHVQTDELRTHSADLAERGRLAEALNDIGGLVHSTLDFDDIMQRALERGVQTLAVDAGTIETRDGPEWIVRYQTGFATTDVGLRLSSKEAPNASLVERRRETLAITDMTADDTINVGFVKAHSLKSVLAAPLIVKDVVGGCLLFYGRQVRAFDEAEIDFGRKLGVTVSLALENARLVEDEREATRLGTTLNEINRLIHGTLDADEIMQRVVAAAVKAVHADSAMIALKHGDDWVAEYGYPPVPGVIHESVRTDEAPFVLTATTTRLPVAIDDCASDPRCVPEVQGRFGVRSVLCIPLIVRDEVIGVVFFNHHAEAVKFEPRTVDFAGKLAAAISAALENAQLYAAQQRIAVTLQENFIHPLPQIAGLELASVSATAFQPDLVGGDFHDAFELPDGRVALLIGDVMGKGVKAAGLTETARTAVRAVALTSPPDDEILPNVNRVLIHETDQLVTVLLTLLDPKTGEALVSSAGHPPPAHLSAAGATLVETGFGPPLGALEYPYKVGRLRLAPGDALVLYTDGVTEARRRGEFFGEAGLLTALRSVEDRRPQLLVDTLRGTVTEFADRLTDDLHILALRLSS